MDIQEYPWNPENILIRSVDDSKISEMIQEILNNVELIAQRLAKRSYLDGFESSDHMLESR